MMIVKYGGSCDDVTDGFFRNHLFCKIIFTNFIDVAMEAFINSALSVVTDFSEFLVSNEKNPSN